MALYIVYLTSCHLGISFILVFHYSLVDFMKVFEVYFLDKLLVRRSTITL